MNNFKTMMFIWFFCFLNLIAQCQFGFGSFQAILNKKSTPISFGISNAPIMVVKAPSNIFESIGQGPIASYNVGSQATTISYEVNMTHARDNATLWLKSRQCMDWYHVQIYGGLDWSIFPPFRSSLPPDVRASIEYLANTPSHYYWEYPNTKVKFAVYRNNSQVPVPANSNYANINVGGYEAAIWQFRIK